MEDGRANTFMKAEDAKLTARDTAGPLLTADLGQYWVSNEKTKKNTFRAPSGDPQRLLTFIYFMLIFI